MISVKTLLSPLDKVNKIFLLLSLVSGLLVATNLRADLFEAEEFTLDNGLHVVVLPNRLAPVVQHMLYYKAGAKDEVPGKSGAAHYLEHLMFKGTEAFPNDTFSKRVAQAGGTENAFTTHDYTGYFQTIAKEHLPMVMEMEADRMSNLLVDAEMIKPELAVVQEERRQRTDNNPRGILMEASQATLFKNHPYGRPIIGWAHEIEALALEDIWAFYQDWYAPNNAVLVVGGDVESAQVKALAERFYGPIPARELPTRLNLREPPQVSQRQVNYADPRVGLPVYSEQYLTPSKRLDARLFGDLGVDQMRAVLALDLFADIIGGGGTSPLYTRLVKEQKIAAGAGAFMSFDRQDYGSFGLYVAPNGGEPLEPAREALIEVVDEILENGVNQEELDQAKRRWHRGAILARDDLRTAPRIVGRALATGLSLDQVQNGVKLLNNISLEEVNQAARNLIDRDRALISILEPEQTKSEEGN